MAGRAAHLLRPPGHRGPLIAAGAAVLAVGIGLAQVRLEEPWGDGVHLLVALLPAALIYWLGIGARFQGGAPAASQSVLLVTGLLLLALALVRLADVLGAGDEGYPSGAFVWTSVLLGGAALYPAIARNSAACALIAAAAFVSVVLNGWDLLFQPESATPFRWLLLLCAIALVLVSLVLRGGWYRHSVVMVALAGLLVLGIAATLVGFSFLFALGEPERVSTWWELVVAAAGFGLVAYGAVDRQPGPVYIGIACLGAFGAMAAQTPDEPSLLYWPLVLLLLGAGAMAAGLRPRDPLPPEPEGYAVADVPLAARTGEDVTVQVRDDQ